MDFGDLADRLSAAETRRERVAHGQCGGVRDDLAAGRVLGHTVAAGQDAQRAERFQPSGQRAQAVSVSRQLVTDGPLGPQVQLVHLAGQIVNAVEGAAKDAVLGQRIQPRAVQAADRHRGSIGSIIRLGNFIDGQIVGSVTTVPWAVKFPDAEGFRHPVVLYDGLKNLLIVPALMYARRRGVPPGGQRQLQSVDPPFMENVVSVTTTV